MSNGLLENILVKTDNLLEKIFPKTESKETVSFRSILSNPAKVLLIPEDKLQDLVEAYPFIKSLQECYPAAEITVVTGSGMSSIFQEDSGINAIEYSRRSLHPFDSDFRHKAAELKRAGFDITINLSRNARRCEDLLTSASEAKIRTGIPYQTSEKYYNLIVRARYEGLSYFEKYYNLLNSMLGDFNADPESSILVLDENERSRGESFVRKRISGMLNNKKLIAAAFELNEKNGKISARTISLINDLHTKFMPTQLIQCANLIDSSILSKCENADSFIHRFDSIREMLAVLGACDTVLTNSPGIAVLVSRLKVNCAFLGLERNLLDNIDKAYHGDIEIIGGNGSGNLSNDAIEYLTGRFEKQN